jgi:NDP-sugar pyrophosphorylase family protein
MKFAIIAAGEGSRLANGGITTPKPLVCLNGEPMIDRLIRIFAANNASSVSIIVNEAMRGVYEHLLHTSYPVPLQVVRGNTPSSMHSFYGLSPTLGAGRFCLTTVDTVFREDEFATFLSAYDDCTADGLFAVTAYADDEKPLYVETDDGGIIRGFHDDGVHRYVSGGIYCLDQDCIPILKDSIEEGMSRMRNYQRRLVKNGFRLQAWPFSKIIDIDRPEDIRKAEDFLIMNYEL